MGTGGREFGAGRGKPAPTGRLGTTVGPNLLWASPIYRPANDLIHFLIRIIYQVTMTNNDSKDHTQIDQERETFAQMRPITISREYGSGGGEIALRLARRLGWQLIDHEHVVHVAQELGVIYADPEEHDVCPDSPPSLEVLT